MFESLCAIQPFGKDDEDDHVLNLDDLQLNASSETRVSL